MGRIIHLSNADGCVIDSVPDDYEDAFTLEPFGTMCETYQKVQKQFLIARVTTMDPKQPEKAFYSYYNAYQLNKILFQTQNYNDKRLLHRLFVLNPLTNSDIVGDVEYFKVEALDELDATSPVHPRELNTPYSGTFPGVSTSPTLNGPEEAYTKMHTVTCVDKSGDIPEEAAKNVNSLISTKLKITIQDPDPDTLQLDNAVKSPLQRGELTQFGKLVETVPELKEDDNKEKQKKQSFQNALAAGSPSFEAWIDETMGQMPEKIQVWRAVQFGTDNDFLRVQKTRHFFRNNALQPEDVQLYQMPDVEYEELLEINEDNEERSVRKHKCSVM